MGAWTTRIGSFLIHPRALLGASALGAAAVIAVEGSPKGLPFLASVMLATAFSVWFFSRRPGLGLLAAWFLVFVSAAASLAKFRFMAVNAHVADIGFYFRDAETLSFLATQMPALVVAALLAVAAGVAVLALAARQEPPSPAARVRVLAGAGLAGLLAWSTHPSEALDVAFYNKKQHFASSFFASLVMTPALFADDPLKLRLAARPAEPPFAGPQPCDGGARPDIVLVLAESAFPPSLYPQIKAPAALSDTFRSHDGAIHRLRVEVFGGGTVTSMVGSLGGLPTSEFGWRAPYLSSYLKGRVGVSLPQRLKECGYETAVVSPLPFAFVDEGPFMASIGIDDFQDHGRMRWKSKQERDRVYYAAALRHLEARRAAGGKPQFVFVLTMAAHSPYDFRFDPREKAPGEPFGNGGEMDEFLRRLAFSRDDLSAFRRALGGLAKARPVFLAEFGDHQPMTTADLARQKDIAEKRAGRDSAGLLTYVAIHPLGMTAAAPMPAVDALDIGFLGATLMQVAGVPPGPVYADLLALRDHCRGRFADCPDERRKDVYLGRLVRSGALRL